MTIGITGGGNDCRMALAVDPQEMMGAGSCFHRIYCNGYAAIGAIFVADRHR